MKLKSLLRTVSLLFASSFLISVNSNAQDAALVPYIVLASDASVAIDAADLSGFYLIKTADGSYFTPIQARTPGDFAQLCMTKKTWALQLIKVGDYYTINWGDKLANYKHNWNAGFGNVETDPSFTQWAIEVVEGNTVKIKRSTESKYIKAEPNTKEGIVLTKLYSDAGGNDEISKLTLVKVTEKRPAIIPEYRDDIIYAASTLNADNLTGKYVIKTSTGGFLSTEFDSIYSSAIEMGAYAFDFVKQVDGTYTISSGDLQANYLDPVNLGFDAKIDTLNTWKVSVRADGVTFQRATGDLFLTNAVNAHDGGNKLLSNGDGTGDVKFTLLKVNTTSVQKVTEDINSYVYQSGKQLIVANISNLKAIAIYNIAGQKVYEAKVNSSAVNIPVASWNKGIYLVKFTDNIGRHKSVKTIVK